MSDLVIFKDLYKAHKDFRTKGFEAKKNQVQVKSAAGSVKSDAKIDFSKDLKLSNTYEWLLEFPLTCFNFPLTFKSKAFSPDNKLELTFEHKNKEHGLTFTEVVTTTDGTPDVNFTVQREVAPIFVTGIVDYKTGKAGKDAPPAGKEATLTAAAVGALAGATLGAQASINLAKKNLTWAIGLRSPLAGGKFAMTVDAKEAFFGFITKCGQGHNCAAEVKVDGDTKQPSFAVAWEDPSKTNPMKARFQATDGLLQLSAGQMVAKSLKATLSADVNVFKGGAATLGLNFLYDDSM